MSDADLAGHDPEDQLPGRGHAPAEVPRGVPLRLLPRGPRGHRTGGRDQGGVPGHLPRQPLVELRAGQRAQCQLALAHGIPLNRHRAGSVTVALSYARGSLRLEAAAESWREPG